REERQRDEGTGGARDRRGIAHTADRRQQQDEDSQAGWVEAHRGRVKDAGERAGFEKACRLATGSPMAGMKELLRGARIDPSPVTPTTSVTELIDNAFLAYNGARLREAVQLFARHVLDDDVTVGMS